MNVGKGILSKLIPLVVAGVAEISPRLSLPRFQLVCSVLMALLLGHVSMVQRGFACPGGLCHMHQSYAYLPGRELLLHTSSLVYCNS